MSSQFQRLPEGGRIARDRAIGFTFNGKRYQGHAGDTLASALLANGVDVVGRSFKYHRPRGIIAAGAEEPNAIIQLEHGARTVPDLRATQVELYDGLSAASVNCWPSVDFDLGVINSLYGRLIPAGFYYKTFMWPGSMWMTYERIIRHAAGLGRSPIEPDPDRYDKMHIHCDVLVVGTGPAGLAAALAAGRRGARVIVAEQDSECGGQLLSGDETIDGMPSADWVAAAVGELRSLPEVTLLPRTTVFGYYRHNFLAALERTGDHLGTTAPSEMPRQRLWKIRAAQVVLATGAIERPLVFADNDRPGVMLAGAARTYVNRYAVRLGRRAVLFTNNDHAYAAALDLATAGIEIAAIVDLRANPMGPLPTKAHDIGIAIIGGHAIVAVHGRKRVKAVDIMAMNEAGDAVYGDALRLDCDLLCVSGGWNPTVHLFSQSGGKLDFNETLSTFVPGETVQGARSAGSANGSFSIDACLAEGFAGGAEAARDTGFAKKDAASMPPDADSNQDEEPPRALEIVPSLAGPGHGRKHFVDFQNDVTAADIALAAREGYRSVEHAKRYTTLGMGTDQGKTGNVNGLAVLAQALGEPIPAVGTTTFRPPYTAVTFGALVGRDVGALADSTRRTPMHHWHRQVGAVFEDVGQWKRPWYYPQPDETMHDAVNRECRAARHAIGILDATTLGKIDIQGRDAVALLNRLYTNDWDALKVGRCRYGLMLGEDGMVMDDGVTTRLGEHHFLMSTTSGNAARVMSWLEEWLQTEWPDLEVHLTSVTEAWSTVGISGPGARKLLGELAPRIDLKDKAFPFMSMREGTVAGIGARVFRISFTGALSYEISVPASAGLALWTALMTAGEKYGITPYGTEAVHVLRTEMGFIIPGQDTDGTVTPVDLGLDWILSKKKDFIGKRSLERSDAVRPDRKQLVGLLTEDPDEVLPEGAHIVSALKFRQAMSWSGHMTYTVKRPRPKMPMIGYVTSSYYSANLGRSIALALVEGGRGRIGETLDLPLEQKDVRARVTAPVFIDNQGNRLDG